MCAVNKAGLRNQRIRTLQERRAKISEREQREELLADKDRRV